MIKRLTLTFALTLAAVCAAWAQKLVIIHSNDTHSQIEPLRTGKNAGLGGVERRLNLIDSIRAEYGDKNVLLLDAGDYNQGTPYFTVGGGDLEMALMNLLGYDAVTIGNHEFDNGQEEFARRLSNSRFPTLCCNYDFSKTPLAGYVKPYTIVRRGGFKIGIVGATARLSSVVSAPNLEGIEPLDTAEEINRWAHYLKKSKRCDIVILLSHLGFEGGDETDVTDDIIAASSRDIDFIIGGHSHTFIEHPAEVKNLDGKIVPIVQAASKGIVVGLLKIY